MRLLAARLAGIAVALALIGVRGEACAVPTPDAAQLAVLKASFEEASAVRVTTAKAVFMSDRPTVDETGVRLSTPGGRPALIVGRNLPPAGRLVSWSEIERLDTGRRHVLRSTIAGGVVGAVSAAVLLHRGPDVAEAGDHFMLALATLSFGVCTTLGYLYGNGYPAWSRVYP
jgi:hypothetical protein